MPPWPVIVVPALFLACLLAPLALSFRETYLDPPGSGDGGGPDGGVTPTPPLPTQSDGACVDPDAVEVDVPFGDGEVRSPSRSPNRNVSPQR